MTGPRLHGTDGIRGRVDSHSGDDESALQALIDQRILSSRAMRIIGEATGLFLVNVLTYHVQRMRMKMDYVILKMIV